MYFLWRLLARVRLKYDTAVKTLLVHVIALCLRIYPRTLLMSTLQCSFIHVSAPFASAISAPIQCSSTGIIMPGRRVFLLR